jgi:Tol biopolymer transport system component
LRRLTRCWILCLSLLGVAALATPSVATVARTRLVSARSNGAPGEMGDSTYSVLSGTGRYVAFESEATNLVPDDENGSPDVFVHDRATGRTRRVSIRSNGAEADDGAQSPAISANGRYVAFASSSSDLVPDDDNSQTDIFVHDRATGRTRRVSVRSNGAEADGSSGSPSLSAGGRYVAFSSGAANLVDGDDLGYNDVFVHDQETGRTRRVSVRSNGSEGNGHSSDSSISAGGRYVAFSSAASNLVSDDDLGHGDVFVHDRETGRTRRVSLRSNGAEANGESFSPDLSGTGRFVAFTSEADNLAAGDGNGARDVFVHDRATGGTQRVSVRSNGADADLGAPGSVAGLAISSGGRYVVFDSPSRNLAAVDGEPDYDVFVHDRRVGRTRIVSLRSNGTEPEGTSDIPEISGNGRFVSFETDDAMVGADDNGLYDVYVRGPLT